MALIVAFLILGALAYVVILAIATVVCWLDGFRYPPEKLTRGDRFFPCKLISNWLLEPLGEKNATDRR